MKVSILAFSQTGNTLKVANAISKGLEKCKVAVSLVRFLHRHKWRPEKADMIGIGCPCFESQPPECVPNFLSGNRFDFSGKKAFVFITSAPDWHADQCTLCGNCAYECPTGNISIINQAMRFHDTCMVWNMIIKRSLTAFSRSWILCFLLKSGFRLHSKMQQFSPRKCI